MIFVFLYQYYFWVYLVTKQLLLPCFLFFWGLAKRHSVLRVCQLFFLGGSYFLQGIRVLVMRFFPALRSILGPSRFLLVQKASKTLED